VTLWFRLAVVAAAVATAWGVALSHVADETRLPISAVVPGAVITQPFGCTSVPLEPFDPLCPSRHVHTGVDLAAPYGTAVRAATAGVAHVGYDASAAGLYVVVEVGTNVRVLYCHLFTTAVGSGQVVRAGDTIGTVGSSGLATGPHLHFEIQVAGHSVEPGQWLATGS
jgi:murein DD-endopeptidase MepM/ murein hydrolase activator NlpD